MKGVSEFRVKTRISAADLEERKGKILTWDDVDTVVTGPSRWYSPEGKLLCVYLPGAIKGEIDAVYPTLHELKKFETDNRGMASGSPRLEQGLRKRTRAVNHVPSSIVGAYEASGNYRYCRLTAFTSKNLEKWQELYPMMQLIGRLFAENVPDRYARQMQEIALTRPEWTIPGTPFTTLTVNNCVDATTECLTRRLGWTNYADLQPDDEVLSYDPDLHLTRWEPLQDIFINPNFKGDLTLLHNAHFSALTTPDHRWPVRRTPGKLAKLKGGKLSDSKIGAKNGMFGRYKHLRSTVMETANLPSEPENGWALVRSAPHEAPLESTYSDAFVRLAAWYFTEGSLRGDGKGWGVSQSQTANPTFVDEIRADLIAVGATPAPREPYRGKTTGQRGNTRRSGLWYREGPANQHEGIIGWGVSGDRADEMLACFNGKDKVPTLEFIQALTEAQAVMFIDTALKGDGSKLNRVFAQSVQARTDAYAMIAVLAGYAPSIWFAKDAEQWVCALNASYPLVWLASVKRTTMYYEGPIWCPSLPSGHWVARRAGRTFITGNTYPTGVHLDKGDLEQGFSMLGVHRRGELTGGHLCFPEYRIAVDMQDGDLVCMDAHQWHGNLAMELKSPDAERISVVAYFRSNMVKCGTASEENQKALARGAVLTERLITQVDLGDRGSTVPQNVEIFKESGIGK